MNLEVLYGKVKELKYNEIERLGADLIKKFINAYVNHEVTPKNAADYIKDLHLLSAGLENKKKLKIIKKVASSKILDVETELKKYQTEIKKLTDDQKRQEHSSFIGISNIYRHDGSRAILMENSEYQQKLKEEVEKLIGLIKEVDGKDYEKARKIYEKCEFDFNVKYFTTQLVATILYPICPKAFPLINDHVQASFQSLGWKAPLKKAKETKEGYVELMTTMDSLFTGENSLNLLDDDSHHFGVIDRIFHVYNMAYKDFNEDSLNVIYYGPPGTGKTYTVNEKLKFIEQLEGDKIVVERVQFHPSFTYEDFIEGIKPKGVGKDGNIQFELVNGIFKKFCIKAKEECERVKKENDGKKGKEKIKPKLFYFVVDEINRANLSSVFGETLSLLEKDYRHVVTDEGDDGLIATQYSALIEALDDKKGLAYHTDKKGEVKFGVPDNIYFIGMMNDVDKSIDTFDLALRRRFKWIRKDCDYEVIADETLYNNSECFANIDQYVQCAKKLNNYISKELGLGKSYEFGHSFFMKITDIAIRKTITQTNLETLFDEYLRPTLKEYLRAFFPENEIEKKLNEALAIFKKPLEKQKKHES